MFLSVLLFTHLALQGIVCYTVFCVLSGGNMSVKCFAVAKREIICYRIL